MNHPNIIIPDRTSFDAKLANFSLTNTRVVTDFDGTMTRPHPSSWTLLDQIEVSMPGYIQAARAVYGKYRPYEINTTLSRERKVELMEEWWSEALGIFEDLKMRREYLDHVSVDMVLLRDGMAEVFYFFETHKIPVLILSAGVKQTIEMVLTHHNIKGNHISLTANEFIFNEEGEYTGVLPEGYIHAGNKDEQHASHHAQSTFQDRSQIILLGDNIHDIDMVPVHERDQTIAIGYCHDMSMIESYKQIYDAVVCSNTSDLSLLSGILLKISNHNTVKFQ